ncbi:predicted protein [Naegleria gruberi]|uniref:Predicted protein n=1 Tax=Naegleria gruberi TaxID=5762 RepID=D2VAT4_NAEGR|nr:uncharacterized protein NAEGRDRAFT_65968 [Naegleria gruberi]EFC46136.1 predicted protein [Naegleria gruberi]|eukprot:XP_002678880.1 predicted protein [Naegleria gruberi strain NEG-M]
MISFRFEEWPEEYIKQMHEYFVETQKLGDLNMAKYSMVNGPIYNLFKGFSWFSGIAERGNCAYWTSNGLKIAHILNSSTMWPKYASIKLYTKVILNKQELWEKWTDFKKKSTDMINQTVGRELITPPPSASQHDSHEGFLSRINETFFENDNEEEAKLAPYWKRSNFNIVTYRCKDERMRASQIKGWVKPFRSLEHLIFDEMDEMSNVIVEVKENNNELVAVPSLKEPNHRPMWNL